MLMEFYLKVSYLLRISVQGTLIEFLMIFILVYLKSQKKTMIHNGLNFLSMPN